MNIKPQDLRIGNWVKIPNRGETQVTGLTNTCKIWLVDNPKNDECAWSDLDPIPLTEEWLLKFGFVGRKLSYCKGAYLITFRFASDISVGLHDNTTCDGTEYLVPNIEQTKYVHQIQNLYFALTGEELTLKP